MKRITVPVVICAAIATLFVAAIVIAQPVGPIGIQRVAHSADMAGSGTAANPLDMSTVVTLPGTLGVAGSTTLAGLHATVVYPAAITGAVNDYAPTDFATATTLILTLSGTTTLSGIAGGTAGRRIELCSTGAFVLSITHDATSTAANRFYLSNAATWSFSTAQMSCASFVYDGTASRWRMISKTGTTFPSLTASAGLTVSGATAMNGSLDVQSTAAILKATISGTAGGTTLTANQVSTGQTADGFAVNASSIGTYDATAAARAAYALHGSNTATRSAGANNLTNYGVYGTASGAQVNYSGFFDVGSFQVNGTAAFAGNTTLGDAASDVITFNNGPIGVNSYAGRHLEWSDDWMMAAIQPTAALNWPAGDIWTAGANASSLIAPIGTTTRPGIMEFSTGTATTGTSRIVTSVTVADFGSGNWTYEAVAGFPTLSVAAQEYSGKFGFADQWTTINEVDGCYLAYDRLPTAGAPGTGTISPNSDKWQCWCASNSVRTGYTMDGVIVSQEAFTTVDSPVAALTLPDTNIYNLKIVMTGSTRAEFYINGTKRCNINTNVPTGAARLVGAGIALLKSAGTTARLMDLDFTRVAVDLTAARAP